MVSSDILDRVTKLSQEIKSLKASQFLGGDNYVPYTIVGGESADIREVYGVTKIWFNSGAIKYDDATGLLFSNVPSVIYLDSDMPFAIASPVSLRVWVNGNEITSWTDVSYGRKKGGGLIVGLMTYCARREQITYASGEDNIMGATWVVEMERDGTTLGVGTTIRYELTIKSSRQGKLKPYGS